MVLNISLQNGKAGIIHRTGNVPAFRLFSWKPQIGLVSEMVVKGKYAYLWRDFSCFSFPRYTSVHNALLLEVD